ncbi:hypothetical protein MKZ38_002697 [Zalerion maritima]|uniref:Uncharacterized protein n=1 Tax=Zalerion maritima TaxID=339359 RepID=A0AAD5WSU9_9PEZI|nr:hypothetical protein MKZ38_002697 [Zalerion maritima]
MTRLGPLTSQALGRSPYDDVVQGTGVGDPREPEHLYDERGRPYNPESRRLNRDIIRSHNEVMLVIGVAEPENGIPEAQAESLREFHMHEEYWGWTLLKAGKRLVSTAMWGVNGTRQRILLYKRYAKVDPIGGLIKHERQHFGFWRYFFSGLPCFLVEQGIEYFYEKRSLGIWNYVTPSVAPWVEKGLIFMWLHNRAFMAMQRAGIFSATKFFPGIKFYIPFTMSSPIGPVSFLPEAFTGPAVARWAMQVGMAIAPAALYIGHEWLAEDLYRRLFSHILDRLPKPVGIIKEPSVWPVERAADIALPPPPPNPSPGGPLAPIRTQDRTERVRRASIVSAGHRNVYPHPDQENQPPPPGTPLPGGISRRQSGFSNRGGMPIGMDEYVSEDEENFNNGDMMNATLISFDVESTDTPPGVWTAELRPNPPTGPDGRALTSKDDEEPKYRISTLTFMPVRLMTHVFASIGTRILTTPVETTWLRLMAWSYRQRWGMSTADLHGVNFLGGWTTRMLANCMQMEVTQLSICSELAAMLILVAMVHTMSEEEWLREHGLIESGDDGVQ